MGSAVTKHPRKQPPQDLPNPYGQLFITTSKTVYAPGDSVSGEIHLNILAPFPGKQLFLRFEGKEVITIDFEIPLNTAPYGNEKTILKKEACIYTWDSLLAGQYTIPYKFTLPQNIPNSFNQEGRTFAAHITYKLEAFIKPDKITGPKLQCEKKLAIREPAKEEVKGHSAEVIVPKSSWYSNIKGVYTLKVHFEKTSYRPGEIARVAMELTTTGPQIHLAEVSFILNQRLRLGTTCNWVLYTIPKAAQVLRGIRTQGPVYANSFSIRIPIFKGDDHDLDKRKKCWPRGTSDDSYGSLSLVTQNKLISSKLLLEVNCTLYGCKKASPKITCPLEVVYPELWEEDVPLPEDWNAQKYPSVDVVFEEGKKVEKKEKKAKKVIKIDGEEIEMKKRAMSHSVVQIFPEGGRQIGV